MKSIHLNHGSMTRPIWPIDLMAWLDGRPASQLFKLLDDLRVRRLYPLSIALLEYAWNSDLPDDRLGRVAEDWIGTVLFGIGDRRGGEEVAEHVIKTSAQHGPAFRSDLGHLLLQWGLTELAEPVVLEAAKSLPGDMSAQFNWASFTSSRVVGLKRPMHLRRFCSFVPMTKRPVGI